MAKTELSKEEKEALKSEKRQKRMLRRCRLRFLKNLLIWFTGVITCLILIVSSLFVGLKYVPLGKYLGGNSDDYVSEDVSSKSIIDAFLKVNTYDMSDFPVVVDKLDELIKTAKLDKYVEVDLEKMKTLKFNNTFTTELQSCVKVTATLDSVGGATLLKDIGKLEVFSSWEEVDADSMPSDIIEKEDGKLVKNPKIYYFQNSSNQYVRAYDDNGNRLDASKGHKLFYANLSKVPILDLADLIDESFGRLKLTSVLTSFGGAKLEGSLIADVLGDKTISQVGDISGEDILIKTFLGEPSSSNQKMYDILCAMVKTDDGVQPLPEQLNLGHLQKGIDLNGVLVSTLGLGENTVEILFDAVNAGIEKHNDNLEPGEAPKEILSSTSQLNVGHLTSLDAKCITLESFNLNDKVKKVLLDAVNGGIEEHNKNLQEGEKEKQKLTSFSQVTIGHLVDLNTNHIKLSSILSYSSNADMYKIILQASGKSIDGLNETQIEELANELDISAFSNFDETNITLNSVLPANDDKNKDLYNILLDVVNGETGTKTAEQITIADLLGFNVNNVNLSTVLPYEDADKKPINTELYNILMDVINADDNPNNDVASKADITLNHLKGFEPNGVKLNTVLSIDAVDKDGKKTNEGLYKILLDVVNAGKSEEDKKTAEEITISDLSNFEMKAIRLSSVLPYEEVVDGVKKNVNTELYDVLLDIINGDKDPETDGTYVTKDKITISHLSDFKYSAVRLNTIMPKSTQNEGLYKILLDIVNGDKKEDQEGYVAYDKITLSNLSSFSYENMHLSTVLSPEENDSLYQILCDVTGISKDDLRLSHLSNFDVSDIHLKTIMESSSNTILQKLIDKNVTISNLATAIDSLSLYEIYGQNCFTAYNNETGVARYRKEGNSYILDANGKFMINSKNKPGIWLFLCFDRDGIETDNSRNALGCGKKYTVSNKTLGDLTKQDSGSKISSQITDATIRELIDAGILPSAHSKVYAKTLKEIATSDIWGYLG